jgi:hypothetical protein
MMSSPVRIEFTLTDDGKRALRKKLLGTSNPWRAMALPAASLLQLVAQSFLAFERAPRRHSAAQIEFSVLFVLSMTVIVGAILVLAYRRWTVAATGALTFADNGISGTLDGRPARFTWHDISSIIDAGEFLVVEPRARSFGRTIALPKTAIADAAALWSQLDDRLVAKRGLIRGRATTRIVNTAY